MGTLFMIRKCRINRTRCSDQHSKILHLKTREFLLYGRVLLYLQYAMCDSHSIPIECCPSPTAVLCIYVCMYGGASSVTKIYLGTTSWGSLSRVRAYVHIVV